LEKAFALTKKTPYTYNNMGEVFILRGDFEKALKNINKSIQLLPSNPYAYRNLGLYYNAINQKKEALTNFKTALKMDSEDEHLAKLIELDCKESSML
jgi:tetratricopeptide (TPR) repeat protein